MLSALLLVLSFPVEAQQAKEAPRIGYLTVRAGPSDQEEAYRQGLRDLGYVEGQSIVIEYRSAAGRTDRLRALAEELVRLKVDIIVARATPAVRAGKDVTLTIPIIMATAAHPLGSRFVGSLAQPGGNITGFSSMMPELAGNWMVLGFIQ